MRTPRIMQLTLMALTPGILALIWLQGFGVVINLVVASLLAVATEACLLTLRGFPLGIVKDSSALLTGVLIALCVPPLLPLWMLSVAVVFGLIFGKHLYGGLGQNIFNPAMVGFALLIVSFPLAMSHWHAPDTENTLLEIVQYKISSIEAHNDPDGMTSATPLDAYKFRQGLTNAEFFDDTQQANANAWIGINVAYLIGGLFLALRGIIAWRTPLAMLGTILLLSIVFYDSGSSASLGSPLLHLFSGATMLAAFFIITDPVTAPGLPLGLIIFGIGVGVITFVIRTVGAYPEGIAFAVLLMNATAPLIDHVITQRGASK